MTAMLDEQREKILELEGDKIKLTAERDRLVDRLLQIEFGDDDKPVKSEPPEPPPAPDFDLVWG